MANLKYSDKHNMVAFLKKPNESVGFTEVVDFLKGTSLRYLAPTLTKKLFANMKRGYAGDIVPLLPAMLAGAAVDQTKKKSTDKGHEIQGGEQGAIAKKINTGLDAEDEINTTKMRINTGIEEVRTGSTKVNSGTPSERGQREGKALMSAQEDSETDKEELVEAMNPTPLTTKSDSVANWKIFQQGQRSVYQIIRANGADTVYMSFRAMIKDFTREDLIELYRFPMSTMKA
ncbi:hypothetical protein Tco_0942795 [Tanacetum coccineum]